MVWQRVLLSLTPVLWFLSTSAQAEEKEPTAIIELGGAVSPSRQPIEISFCCEVVHVVLRCPYRKSNPLAVDRESSDAAARCWICAN
jgi:hypothetical protein